jgi:hypothetical protein
MSTNNKNYELIQDRLSRIKSLIGGKIIDEIDFKNSENIINNNNNKDIRSVLQKKYINFNNAINDLGGKLVYVKSGSTGHTFKGIHAQPNIENKQPYAVKIVAYPKKENYGDMYNTERPENTELLMISLLSSFVINKQTPHIVLPITTFNTSIKPFLNLTKNNIVNNKKFDQFIEKYDNGDYYQNVSVLISEWANGGDLLDYIRKNYKSFKIKDWRVIFFQILSVLAIIHAKYPSFRHNDMKANNILVHIIDINPNNKKYLYKINGQEYIVPNIGIQLKLWDFDFASIEGIIENAKVNANWTDKININNKKNRYYDIHYFLNTLTRKGFFPEFWSNDIPEKVKEFVLRVIPEKFQSGSNVSDRGRILIKDEYLTPDEILKNDEFFKIMRK